MNEKSNGAISLDDFLKLSKVDRLSKMKSGEFVPPKKAANPQDFERFTQGLLKDPEAESAPVTPEAEPKKEEELSKEPVKDKDKEPPAEKPTGRFKSIEEADKFAEEKESLINTQQESLKKLNEENESGKRLIEKLQADIDAVNKKIAEAKPEKKTEEVVIPEPPEFNDEAPDSGDKEKYPEGEYDENFIRDNNAFIRKVSIHNKEMVVYGKKLGEALKRANEIRKDVEELRPKVEAAHSFRESESQRRAREEAERGKSESDAAIDQIQKDLGLSTKTPWKVINDNVLIANSEKANPEAKAAAQAFLSGLSKEDKDSFNSLAKAAAQIVKNGKPQVKVGSKTYRGILEDAGFSFKEETQAPKKEGEVDLTKVKPESQGSSGIPADRIGGDDMKLMTRGEKIRKFRELQQRVNDIQSTYSGSVKSHSPQLWAEYTALTRDLGVLSE